MSAPRTTTSERGHAVALDDLLASVDPIALGAALSVRPVDDPHVVAVRSAIEVGALRAGTPFGLDDYVGGRYHRPHELAEYSETQRRRWPPTGDRETWIKYGPAGPPSDKAEPDSAASAGRQPSDELKKRRAA